MSSVEGLECGSNGLDPRAGSDALTKLADTLSLRPGLPNPSAQRVHRAAERIDSHAGSASRAAPSPDHRSAAASNALAVSNPTPGAARSSTTSPAQGERRSANETLQEGLAAALQGLLAQPGPVEYRGAVERLARSLDAMRAEEAPRDQCQEAITAFRAATDAVFVGLRGEAPFAGAEPDAPESQPLVSMLAGIEPARAMVVSLSGAGWQHARNRAAEALRLLAAMLSSADCGGTLKGEISKLRFQAERLTRSDALSFGQTRWIKQGLTAALDALDVLDTSTQSSSAENATGEPTPAVPAMRWTRAARAAVANIDPDGLFGLQRTPIQDGMRATLDAFAVAANSAPACQQ